MRAPTMTEPDESVIIDDRDHSPTTVWVPTGPGARPVGSRCVA